MSLTWSNCLGKCFVLHAAELHHAEACREQEGVSGLQANKSHLLLTLLLLTSCPPLMRADQSRPAQNLSNIGNGERLCLKPQNTPQRSQGQVMPLGIVLRYTGILFG